MLGNSILTAPGRTRLDMQIRKNLAIPSRVLMVGIKLRVSIRLCLAMNPNVLTIGIDQEGK